MGHAGAFAGLGDNDARTKFRLLEDAGVTMVNHPEKFGSAMKSLLSGSRPRTGQMVSPIKRSEGV